MADDPNKIFDSQPGGPVVLLIVLFAIVLVCGALGLVGTFVIDHVKL